MIQRKTICYSDNRVIEAVRNNKNASRFFEEAAIYYIESIEEERISRETVKDIVINVLKDIVVTRPISNPNYVEEKGQLLDNIMSIIDSE